MSGPIAKRPAPLVAHWIDDCHSNRFLEAFKPAKNDGAMRPRAGERDVEMIAGALRFVRRRAIALHPVAKRIFLALERTAFGLLVGKLGHARL